MIEIEKGIPVPPRRGKWQDLLSSMAVGDSVLVSRTQYSAFFIAAKNLGVKITSRGEGDKVRVWRAE